MLYLYVLPVGELAKVQGSVLDVIADRTARRARRRHHGLRLDHQPCGEHQRDDIRRPARVLRDGARRVFFAAAAKVHPKFKTPARAIVAQAVWASLLVLSGSADALTNYTGFAIVLFAGIAVPPLFVLRAREPNAPRPFKALGYPVAPAIFVAACFVIVVNGISSRPQADRRRPARDGCRYPAIHLADTAAKSAGLKPGTT